MLDNDTARTIDAAIYRPSFLRFRVLAVVAFTLITISPQAYAQDAFIEVTNSCSGISAFVVGGRSLSLVADERSITFSPDGSYIAHLVCTWEKAGDLRRGTETAYANGHITSSDYSIALWDINQLEEVTLKKSAVYFLGHGSTAESWIPSPDFISAYSSGSASATSFSAGWIEMYRKRMLLELDLTRGIINEAEYHERKQSLLNQEQELAKKHPLSESEMITYYENVSRLPADIARLKEYLNTRPSLIVVLAPWGTASVALLAAILGFILSLRKDSRERKEMEFKELQARETAVRIGQLEQSKDMQLEELKLKIRQLEQQLVSKESKLILPA